MLQCSTNECLDPTGATGPRQAGRSSGQKLLSREERSKRSFLAAVGASLTVHSEDGRLIVIAFDSYLLPGLVIQVNFFLTFLFHQLVPGLTLLDIV
jgi:hypothetical protein